jgi:glycosyltransferase involved in cell wall biosynthesis
LYSIIIPTLNEEKIIKNLLNQLTDSELKSKFDYEIIISDGGSSDKTLEIAKEYDVKIIEKPKNTKQNIAMGRNAGGFAASGNILIFFNADITIENPLKLFLTIKNDFENSDYLAMTCDVRVSPEEEILIDKIFHTIYNRYLEFLNYIHIGMGRGECHIVRKEVFVKVNGYDEKLAAGEDFDLFRRIRYLGKIAWRRDLKVFESPRRYRKLGYLKVWWMWSRNAFSVMLTGKSFDSEWSQVR